MMPYKCNHFFETHDSIFSITGPRKNWANRLRVLHGTISCAAMFTEKVHLSGLIELGYDDG
jgi:hypothetical protein